MFDTWLRNESPQTYLIPLNSGPCGIMSLLVQTSQHGILGQFRWFKAFNQFG